MQFKLFCNGNDRCSGHWSENAEHFFHQNCINLIQSGRVQKLPQTDNKAYRLIRRYTGKKNSFGTVYTVRNAWFEPFSDPVRDWVSDCLRDIEVSFKWGKPAIIESHRANYVGSINADNRNRNLKKLSELLNRIISVWPDVEFISSDQLTDIMLES